jgi:hypothetical protein
MTTELIPNRSCGTCNACCWALKIDDPELKKVPVAMCPNWKQVRRCTIYKNRPETCRDWNCGWRFMPLGDEWRPDLCGLLIVSASQTWPARPEDGVQFELIGGPDKIYWPPFLILVADFMRNGVPVYLSVLRGEGFSSIRASLSDNAALRRALQQNDILLANVLLLQTVQVCLRHPKIRAEFDSETTKQDMVVN